jgi:hypothetical protein
MPMLAFGVLPRPFLGAGGNNLSEDMHGVELKNRQTTSHKPPTSQSEPGNTPRFLHDAQATPENGA